MIAVAGRHLYLVDRRGQYLGGRALPAPIISGPVVLDGGRIAVDTGDEVLILRRRPR